MSQLSLELLLLLTNALPQSNKPLPQSYSLFSDAQSPEPGLQLMLASNQLPSNKPSPIPMFSLIHSLSLLPQTTVPLDPVYVLTLSPLFLLFLEQQHPIEELMQISLIKILFGLKILVLALSLDSGKLKIFATSLQEVNNKSLTPLSQIL